MPLDLRMLHAAVRIDSIGDFVGTGFLMSVPSEHLPGVRHGYVLTARHVIANAIEVNVRAPDPFTTGALHSPVAVEDWRQPLPSVDLAIAPFPSLDVRLRADPSRPKYVGVHVEDSITTPALGGVVHYIGIFAPLGRPMARSGTIGALDQVGIEHEGDYAYNVHLVDCRSYEGFSGSPCFAEFDIVHPDRPPPIPIPEIPEGERLGTLSHLSVLCGMFTAHYSDPDTAGGVHSRYGVGTMLTVADIHKALLADEQREERAMWDEELEAARKRGQPPLRNAGMQHPTEQSEFERFEDLTRKLVNVPKRELGEKRRDES